MELYAPRSVRRLFGNPKVSLTLEAQLLRGACFCLMGNCVRREPKQAHSVVPNESGPKTPSGIRDVVPGGFANHMFIFNNAGKITDNYNISSKKLGQGTYGSVSKASQKAAPNAIRAVKTISKSSSQVKNLTRFKQEIDIMKSMDHPNIVKLYETFEDARTIFLVSISPWIEELLLY